MDQEDGPVPALEQQQDDAPDDNMVEVLVNYVVGHDLGEQEPEDEDDEQGDNLFRDMEDLVSNSSENGLDNSDVDEEVMFDEYIVTRERLQSTAAEIYNTELPTEHAYLGKLERVEGVDYLEPGKIYRLPICSHNSIVFPGEVVPMIINVATLNCNDPSGDGVKFGLVFRNVVGEKFIYGVTCQVFERGERDVNSGSIVLKTVAQQRFRTVRHLSGRRAEVLILPEILLPDPLLSSCSNAMKRHAVSNSKECSRRIRSFLSHGMVWPKFVYDQYGTDEVISKVNRYLAFLKIESVPSDPVKLSFWLARNIPIDEADRKRIYEANAVITRMLIINKSLDHMCYFICKRCQNEIGSYNDIFAMSKQGIQTSYCNPAGYVHETLTIYKTKENSTFTIDRPSTEFSWFPGYSWQITLCSNCRQHLGWKFVATKKNYLPKSFYGLSGTNIQIKSATPSPEDTGLDDTVEATDDEDNEFEDDDVDPTSRQQNRMDDRNSEGSVGDSDVFSFRLSSREPTPTDDDRISEDNFVLEVNDVSGQAGNAADGDQSEEEGAFQDARG